MTLKPTDRAQWKAFQAFLNTQGENLTVDAHPGPLTIAAVKRFQTASGLPSDGLVGDKTIAAAKAKGFKGFPSEPDAPTSNSKLVLISAGHTNNPKDDRGAASGKYIEGVETLKLRDRTAEFLREQGVSVIEDGADGKNEPLSKALVLARKADIAIEWHFNAGPATAHGVEILSKPNKKELAQKIAAAIAFATGFTLRGDKGWKSDSSGQHHRLAFCEVGGLIVETAFLSNPSEMATYEKTFEAICQNVANVLAKA